MPIRSRATQMVLLEGDDGEKSLKITIELELNINLNSQGVQATIGTVAQPTEETTEEDEFSYVIPEFDSSEKINFGKKVDTDQSQEATDSLEEAVRQALSKRQKRTTQLNER